jgi:iron complex transport system ATP-binding protein
MITDRILHTQNLKFGYKTSLCSPANLDATEGDIICMIGRNGCGKSTLLNTLAGILPKLDGHIHLKGNDLSKIPLQERSKLLSFVPSKPEYLSNLKVFELVSMGRSPYTNIFDSKNESDNEIINSALKKYNLEDFNNRPLWSMSDGERQKAMICRAVVQETPVIILDEPTAFLDYYFRQMLMSELRSLSADNKKCIIFSSHDIELSLKFATKVWYFENSDVLQFTAEDFVQKSFYRTMIDF